MNSYRARVVPGQGCARPELRFNPRRTFLATGCPHCLSSVSGGAPPTERERGTPQRTKNSGSSSKAVLALN